MKVGDLLTSRDMGFDKLCRTALVLDISKTKKRWHRLITLLLVGASGEEVVTVSQDNAEKMFVHAGGDDVV